MVVGVFSPRTYWRPRTYWDSAKLRANHRMRLFV
jgi:hypothetical protein